MDNFGIISSKPFEPLPPSLPEAWLPCLQCQRPCSDQHRQQSLCCMQINKNKQGLPTGKHSAVCTLIQVTEKKRHGRTTSVYNTVKTSSHMEKHAHGKRARSALSLPRHTFSLCMIAISWWEEPCHQYLMHNLYHQMKLKIRFKVKYYLSCRKQNENMSVFLLRIND